MDPIGVVVIAGAVAIAIVFTRRDLNKWLRVVFTRYWPLLLGIALAILVLVVLARLAE